MQFHIFHTLNKAKKSKQIPLPTTTVINIETRNQLRLIFSKLKEVRFVLSKCAINESKEKEIEKIKKKPNRNCNINN
jgi:hypothetical protein